MTILLLKNLVEELASKSLVSDNNKNIEKFKFTR